LVAAATAPTKKERVVSGPQCVCCGVRFSGAKQLAEHEKGKRHQMAASVAAMAAPPRMELECRQAMLDEAAVRGALGKIAPVRSIAPRAPETVAVMEGDSKSTKTVWRASVTFETAAGSALALGQKYLYVGEARVYLELGN
jgi:hypothetical protein